MDQYSVEVKSRFSLFLDDSLNNEDPDLLLSKLQSKRTEKSKKDKQHTVHAPEPEKLEPAPKEEPKPEAQTKEVVEGNHVDAVPRELPEAHPAPQIQGRGGPRGYSRGFRGGRGFGPRPNPPEWSQEPQGDLNVEPSGNRDVPYEPRGRGRGRGFGRGRGRGSAYTDYREFDRGGMRPRGRGGYSGGPRGAPEEEANTPIAEGGDGAPPEVEMTETPVETEENGVDAEAQEAVEEEPKSYTLEEYKAMKSSAKPAVTLSTKGARKANDGKDVFANMVAHRKLNEVSDEEVEEVEKEPEEPQPFDIDVSFTDRFGERGRGSRGFNNRGFDRGRGTNFRGRPRGGRGDAMTFLKLEMAALEYADDVIVAPMRYVDVFSKCSTRGL
ncbi:unnamed protein product [Echinostoma caproni]|uniref:HABP4_PAI-RBP1 domain-containing protein n=1 Tax=Echinostoma caproni TaxID=27848 RepID=A0A183AZL0_9TREM|nr:unnamed protein product [Echinostoma caproni]